MTVYCMSYLIFHMTNIKLYLPFFQTPDTISLSPNTERLMEVSKTPKHHLPSGSQALIKWAEEHSYGPVTSYTHTPVANTFNLRLREPGKTRQAFYIRLRFVFQYLTVIKLIR